MIDGILNINKATGMTSHDVVAIVRKTLKQKRVGHAGTLDPAAGGVLPICVGQATRVAEYLSENGKAYQADIVFGIVTDTYDVEGEVVRSADASSLTLQGIQAVLPHFLGRQMQMPPCYSAIKIAGQPAYKHARKGEEVILEPRPIEITRLDILAWKPPCLTLAVECSKGTYIRSLAYDLGELLGCGAHLGALVRTRSGPLLLADSITLEQLAEAVASGTVHAYLHSADVALQQYPVLTLNAENAERVLHGNTFKFDVHEEEQMLTLARVYDDDGHFIAVAQWDAEQEVWQPEKVFAVVDAREPDAGEPDPHKGGLSM
jgi:tRNA pseudouridine55 synthase